MAQELYKRVSPHLQRVLVDGGTTTSNMNDLLLLQRSNEQYRDYLKLSFCPELYGYKKDTRSGINYVTKGYSANSIQQELGNTNYWNLGVVSIAPGASSVQLNNLTVGKQYIVTAIKNNDVAINFGDGWIRFTNSEKIVFKTNQFWCVFMNLGSTNTYSFIPEIREYIPNDLTQTSSANQPYLDKIAPAEKLSAKNPNGGSNYLTHPAISFNGNDKWTAEVVVKNNSGERSSNKRNSIFGNSVCKFCIGTTTDIDDGKLEFVSNNVQVSKTTKSILHKIGKTSIITIVANGDNSMNIYIDGLVFESFDTSLSNRTNFVFEWLLLGRDTTGYFLGNVFSYHIFSKALSASEVAERSAILRSIFPEIPFTRIGEQIWSVRNFEAVVTPQGNLIAEIQANGNVEKITNAADRDFSSDTGWWTKSGSWSITGGIAQHNVGDAGSLVSPNILIPGRYYKITYYNYNTQPLNVDIGGTAVGYSVGYTQVIGINTLYGKCGNSTAFAFQGGGSYQIDNVSIQEIGWSGSQELYDGIYAATSGTTEQKTYAAVKAAAMWCHYNNDVTLGATYGKLYNWFAVKLLQMDIDYYNANNPATPWGWRVPTQADFNTLATTLGGASVAGGKMKSVGTSYWNSPNTRADNSSWFSAIGAGQRVYDGNFYDLKGASSFWNNNTYSQYKLESGNSILAASDYFSKIYGFSLRLIKT